MELHDTIKDYWEGEADVYSSGIQKELQGPLSKAWKDLVLGYAPHGGMLDILDVGTGPGFFPIVLGREGHHVTGIDVTENMIRTARDNATAAGILGADLRVMDGQEPDFPEGTFDMVLCRNLTWTLDDPEKAYRSWLSVLKPQGVLLVFDGNWYSYLFDDELAKRYHEYDAAMKAKYGRGIHAHADAQRIDEFNKNLFMSDKDRPAWDLGYLIGQGVSKVFAEPDISERVLDKMTIELNKFSPTFLVGAVK